MMIKWLTERKIQNIRILTYISSIPILFILFLLYGTYKDNALVDQIYTESINYVKAAKFDSIKVIIKEKNIQCKQNTNKLKEYIIKDIFSEYGHDEMDVLKEDMHSNRDSRLSNLLHNNMNKIYIPHMDGNNRLWVANREGILADKETLMAPNRSFRNWQEEYSVNINKVLYKNTIDRIILKDVYGDILYIDGPSIDNYIEEVDSEESGYKNLEKMYREKGLEEISKYNILVCSYIYDSYDIFNVPDVTPDGTFTNNDTIIIVEQYNIGDVMKDHEALFRSYNIMIDRYEYWREQTKIKNINDMISLMVIMLISFFLILGTASIYTNWSEKHNGEYNKHFDD